MADATQATRPLAVNTPLGDDALLLLSITGQESLSQLFRFQLETLAPVGTEVPFDQLLGQGVSVRLELSDQSPDQRYFVGICSRVTQGESDDDYTTFFLEMVPPLWLLTRKAQSRIFQHKNVPDILKEVLAGLDVDWQIQGTFEPRDFCVQYRETDFNFASRVMEEEGIYYFFQHSEDGCKMIVANTPGSHTELEGEFTYRNLTQGATMDPNIIYDWGKTQELASGKYTLWDHTFELPHKHLEAERPILDSVAVGSATHKLALATNSALEIYDYPGEYAQRFDGIDKGGGEQPAEVQKIFDDNQRTVNLRMQQEAAASLVLQGASNARILTAGHKMKVVTLETDAASKPLQVDGAYVLTSVSHSARMGLNFKSGDGRDGFQYANRITCIPEALPFRPQRTTPKPIVAGTQTAVVVGPPGEEIFTDKYSRVKVQFHWDRQGKYDADSSCWIRVATVWAGKQWGVIHIPRINDEVIVDFLEGDPDQPIIVGSVYNASQMPPTTLPKEKMVSGTRTNTTPGGGGFNGMVCNDTKAKETIIIHAQKDMHTTVEHDQTLTVVNDRTVTITGKLTETITKDTTIKIVSGPYSHDVAGNKATYHVSGDLKENYDATQTTTVGSDIKIYSMKGEILIEAAKKITLHTGSSTLTMEASGKITLDGVNIGVIGKADIKESAPAIEISGTKETKYGVGAQTVTCDPAKLVVSGIAITSTAVGMHEISGAMIKLN